jgi:transcription initiation factor IIE alpha subunit
MTKGRDERTPDLFDFDRPLYVRGSDTSLAAALSIEPDIRGRLRIMVYQFILARGAHGATDDEMEAELEMKGSTVRPRRRELEVQNAVIDSGKRRMTRSGRSAAVWILPRFKGPEE